MRVTGAGALAVVGMLAAGGCSCPGPSPSLDGGQGSPLAWPPGAMLEVAATTASSATLRWPRATGPLTGYQLSVTGRADIQPTDETYQLDGLVLGQHLTVSVVAYSDSTSERTEALSTEVGPAEPLDVPDGDVSLDFCAANAFLRRGTSDIACDVLSVLVGWVRSRGGAGVPGVTVSILGHPELGSTVSQADGKYALAVPAGRWTVEAKASSFLAAQRWATARPKDFSHVEDVVVLRRDSKSTVISLPAGGLHRGTAQADADGSRSTTVFIPPGRSASLVLADGGVEGISALTLRVTESTVGPKGPAAMPATLPPSTAYTYAADVTADEADARGATGIRFDGPVAVYNDDFLAFPLGAAVPLGAYDATRGVWEGLADARVVKVLGDGRFDTDGDGVADDAVGQLPGEAEALRASFPAGTVLVRSLTSHFTTLDTNPAKRCLGSCVPAGDSATEGGGRCDGQCGSVTHVQDRTLSEYVDVAGTSLRLAWHSNRGGQRPRVVAVELGNLDDGGAPVGVKSAYFALDVAGQRLVEEKDTDGGVAAALVWDGRDVFGRPVRGPVAAVATYGYGFGGDMVVERWDGGDSGANFARWPQNGTALSSRTRTAGYILKSKTHLLGDWVPREGLGNLSLDVVQGYAPATGTLHLGDGTDIPGDKTAAHAVVRCLRGVCANPDGGLPDFPSGASYARLIATPKAVYLFSEDGLVLWRVDEGARPVAAVAGKVGVDGYAGDGEDASKALFRGWTGWPPSAKADAEGNVYLVDHGNFRIRRIDAKTNVITTVVGNGTEGVSPDGTRALDASLKGVGDILPARDGMLYFMADAPYWLSSGTGSALRRITPGGLLETVSGVYNERLDVRLEPESPRGIELDAATVKLAEGVDGSIYLAGEQSGDGVGRSLLRRVEPDGRVTVVAGLGGLFGRVVSTEVARWTTLSPITDMAVGVDGVVYLVENGNHVGLLRGEGIVAVFPDGLLSQVAGGWLDAGDWASPPPDGVGQAIHLFSVRALAVRPSGALLFVNSSSQGATLHIIDGLAAGNLIPNRAGTEVYAFDGAGRHLFTADTTTGRRLWVFGWGPHGLDTVTDADGNVTQVERDASGKAVALKAPDGQRTTLDIDGTGAMRHVTDSEGRTVGVTWYPSGLLQQWTDANGHSTTLEWDEAGRLRAHTNALGAQRRYRRLAGGVEYTSPEGRVTSYGHAVVGQTEKLDTLTPDGTASSSRYSPALQHFERPDGTVIDITLQPGARFGRPVEVPGSTVTKLPSGLTSTVTSKRTVTTGSDVLSVVMQTDATVVNGKQWNSLYDGASRTLTTTSPLGRGSTTVLDEKLRVAEVQLPGMLPLKYLYDGRGRLASASQGTRSLAYTYGANGFADSLTNALGEKAQYVTDTTGRVGRVLRPDAEEVLASYDAVGNVTGVTPAESGTHQFAYNAVNMMETYSAPPLQDVGSESASYDLDQAVKTTGWADGSQSVVTRDAAGRVSRVTSPWWQTDVTYLPTGQVDALTRGAQSVSWLYDGRLPVQETATGVTPAVVQWGYDSDFRVRSLTVGGTAVAYGYDDDGLPVQVGDVALVRSPSTGQLQTETVGNLVTTYTHNSYGELASQAATRSGAAVYNEALTYDGAGRIVAIDEAVSGATTHWAYAYDALGRLTSATKDGVVVGSWAYSGNGNRVVDGTLTSTFDAQDRSLTHGARALTYDALGGRASMKDGAQVMTYVHDGLGALLSVKLPSGDTVSYDYDGLQRRVAKRRNGQVVKRWAYDGQTRVVAEVDGSGAVTSRFVYLPGAQSPEYMVRGGVTYRYVTNHLGSVRLVVNVSTGEVAQRLDYDAWGNVASDSNPGFQAFGLAGGLLDRDTGLTHFGFRDYDASTGTWTTKAPLRLAGGSNVYAYALNNPVMYSDPTGQLVWTIPIIIAVYGPEIAATVAGFAAGIAVAVAAGSPSSLPASDPGTPESGDCSDARPPKCRPCLPVPVGGTAYDYHSAEAGQRPHNGMANHTHHFQMNQSPPPAGCRCFWKRDFVDPTADFSPLPGAVRVSPAAGGGIAP